MTSQNVLKLGSASPSTLFYFLKIVFTTLDPFPFHINFRIRLVNFYKPGDRDSIEFVD